MFDRLRISTKFLLAFIPLIFLAIGTSAYLNNVYEEAEMLSQARASAQTYADIIRESLVNMMVTREMIDDKFLARLNTIPDIRELRIHFRPENLFLREVYQQPERLERLRKRVENSPPLGAEDLRVFSEGEPILKNSGTMIKAVIPFKATSQCVNCHNVPEGYVLGAAEMGISIERISTAIANNWFRSFGVFLGFTLLAVILCVLIFRMIVAQRMNVLLSAIKEIGSGNLDHPISGQHVSDELGELAQAFDTMRIRLKESQQKALHSERLATVGQMASSIIHDFRTPMSTINLAIHSLQRGIAFSPEKTAQWYGMIRDAVSRMIMMAQELLDFSKGETRLDRVEVSIQSFIEKLASDVRGNLEQSSICLEVQQNYSGIVSIDADRLYRALINIINNAQDAMPNGGRLRISTTATAAGFAVSISDTGTGVLPEIRETMFDAFVTLGKKKGTGLGLAITKRIIDQHGGTIAVESEQGKGTSFHIVIPQPVSEAD